MTDQPTTENRRQADRIQMHETVTVTISSDPVTGPGKNISEQGLFFVADARIPVEVRIKGVDGVLAGELVRVQTMKEGKIGIAVRFLDPPRGLRNEPEGAETQ
ncbi:MAG: hypothetical protein Fur0037_18940 [Planctomycetota bacterium]